MTKEEQLEARISNLENLVHSLWALISPLQPPTTWQDGQVLFAEHFNKVKDISGEYMKGEFTP